MGVEMSVPIGLLVYVSHLDVEKSVCIECPGLHLMQDGNAECTAFNSASEFKTSGLPGECVRTSIAFDENYEPLPASPQAPALPSFPAVVNTSTSCHEGQGTSKTGWWNPNPAFGTSRWHYIGANGRSLCGRWQYFAGELEQGQDDSPDHCKSCRKALAASALPYARVYVKGKHLNVTRNEYSKGRI